MTVGIVGLGLIGGSFAKAYSDNDDHTVLGYDINKEVMEHAFDEKTISGELGKSNISECDLVLIALYPETAVNYLKEMAEYIAKDTMVIDCCGVKGYVCERCFPIAEEYGFTFVGGHPMAGRHYSGYDYSMKNMYNGASMVLVPRNLGDEKTIKRAKQLLSPIKFGTFTVCDAKRHDAMIAFTSQMAHVVSNAYVKSPTAREHDGFSAGSYKDLTRVAWLNENMWTELFLENKDCLLTELDCFINSMREYRDAIKNEDADTLRKLLHEGKICKEEIDGI
ncbi:MAG: prephenate dehydrogenase/arogenate dehydrogenase family protein [Lachnospiraceae bacterium]|nr:prephenate dehydrogenase/arogenate dehydrogenase family protein [Lachnospiraceae bacterium]MBQ9234269.1 prephenate dehydrogenase/arogenate dehydrogenase family protein [Lachnospiraceae bacterium]